MRKINLIALLAIVVGLFGLTTRAALAQSGFCSGSEPWIFDHQALENTPPCGQGTYVLVQPWADGGPYNTTYKVSADWASHVRFLKANGYTNGSFWFQPGVSAPVAQPTSAPVNTTAAPGVQPTPTAVANPPSAFNCSVGASTIVAGPAMPTPPCPSGTVIYALDIEQTVIRFTDWGQAEAFRAGRVGTYWIEALPESVPPDPTEPTGGFNWGWCLWPLVLVGLILGGIWLWRRRRRPTTPPAPRPAPSAPTAP